MRCTVCNTWHGRTSGILDGLVLAELVHDADLLGDVLGPLLCWEELTVREGPAWRLDSSTDFQRFRLDTSGKIDRALGLKVDVVVSRIGSPVQEYELTA